jgi:hypothetical protein
MSRGSEDNFELGVKVCFFFLTFRIQTDRVHCQINIDSVRSLLESTWAHGKTPIKFIFTSSLAVYGGPLVRLILLSIIRFKSNMILILASGCYPLHNRHPRGCLRHG